jgi:hypothetical protein
MRLSTAGFGYIQYYFKGMRMKSEPAEITTSLSNNSIIVTRKSDKQVLEFVHVLGDWLLKSSTKPNDLLYGTRFTLSL